jgi:oligosaccharide repeat unit polymerase
LATAFVVALIALSVLPGRGLLSDLPPALLLGLLAVLALRSDRGWLAVGPFFFLFWTVLTWLALVFVSDADVWTWAIWWIVASAAAVYLGSLLAGWLSPGRSAAPAPGKPTWPALEVLIMLSTACGLLAVLILLRDRGIGLDVFLSPQRLAHIAQVLSRARYAQGYLEPFVERFLSTGIFLAALLAGLLLATKPSGLRRGVVLLPLVPAMAHAALLTTKATILFTLVLLMSSYLASRLALSGGRLTGFPVRRWWTVGAVVTLGVVLLLIQLARYGYSVWNGSQLLTTLSRLRVFFFGYLAVFSNWFEHGGWSSSRLSLGADTFAGLFDLARLHPRSPGVYTEMVPVGSSHIRSNIYTIFRGLIEDYTLVGALLVLVMVGFLAGIAFRRVTAGNLRYVPILSAFYGVTLTSFTVDLFAYNTLLLAFICFSVYVLVARRAEPLGLESTTARAPASR